MHAQENFFYTFQYNGSIPIKLSIMYSMVPTTILALGTEQHHHLAGEFSSGNVCINKIIMIIIKYIIFINVF